MGQIGDLRLKLKDHTAEAGGVGMPWYLDLNLNPVLNFFTASSALGSVTSGGIPLLSTSVLIGALASSPARCLI